MRFSLRRVRMVLIGVTMVLLALFAGRVFDQVLPGLVIAAVLPTVAALSVVTRSDAIRFIVALGAILGGVAAVVALHSGTVADFGASFGPAIPRLLSTDWPSPQRADLIGVVAAALAITSALGAETAGRRRFHLLPLVPITVAYVGLVAFSAPLGMGAWWLLGIGLVSLAFATLRYDDRIDAVGPQAISSEDQVDIEPSPPETRPSDRVGDRLARLQGERRVLPVVLLALVAAALVSAPIAFDQRADPRGGDPPDRTSALVDPIESTLALRAIDPPIPLHVVSGLSAEPPARWRTTALDRYDGLRWTPTLAIRPIGRRLGEDRASMIDFELQTLEGSSILVPLPGAPITVDGPSTLSVETDENRTVVRLIERPRPSDVLRFRTSSPTSSLGAVGAGAIVPRPVGEEVSALTSFARTLAGDGTLVEQLQQIEATMREDYVLSSDAPGAGQQRALIERFVRETQRGTAEQFASGYVLLARSLGVEARVATGFIVDPADVEENGRLTITSADAAVWPEVRTVNGGWVALDPVPSQETSDVTPPPEEPALLTPAAAQPPIAAPPDPGDSTRSDVDDADDRPTTRSAAITRLARRIAVVGGIAVLPLLIVVLLVIGAKYVRRRRRLRAAGAADRVRGAWSLATDHLVDAGLRIESSDTNGDIAGAGAQMAATSRSEIHRLANLASAVTFGEPEHPERLATESAVCLRTIEHNMAAERTWSEQARWRLSLRSLRPSTRSPVRD